MIHSLTLWRVLLSQLRRLFFIGDHCPAVAVEAFRECLRELVQARPLASYSNGSLAGASSLGPNPQLYMDIIARARELLLTPSNQPEHQYFLSAGSAGGVASDPLFALDSNYMNAMNKNYHEVQHQLETQLQIQKRDGEREQIKAALWNLAEFYHHRGDFNGAINKYLESKEFVSQHASQSTNMELLQIALNIIKNSIQLTDLMHVKTQVQRAQRLVKEITSAAQQQQQQQQQQSSSSSSSTASFLPDSREARITNAKLNAAMGLHQLKGQAQLARHESLFQN